MSELAFTCVESGLRFAQQRASVLAADTANARTPDFQPKDISLAPVRDAGGMHFATMLRAVQAARPVGLLEYAMAAQGQNAVRYHALADQERAMLHELRTVADEARH